MIPLDEYARLLGYPAEKRLEGDVLDRAEEALAWFERHGEPHLLVRDGVAALTAGVEVEDEIASRWSEDRVDEAYFLDRLAAGVVEHLARSVGVSPGREGWDVRRHFELIEILGEDAPVQVLDSGMLRPVHSILAVVTGARTTCERCACRCDFRRTA